MKKTAKKPKKPHPLDRDAFTLTDALVAAYRGPSDVYFEEESGLDEAQSGVWIASDARSENPPSSRRSARRGATRG